MKIIINNEQDTKEYMEKYTTTNPINKERLFNFLKDDLEKLEKNISVLVDMINTTHLHYSDTQKPLENIDNFLSYWKQHINDLNK